MSYGTSSGNPGPSSQADIQLTVQKKLHSLLEHLGWSYVALWSFNPQSRSLEWTGGHFKGNSPAHSNADIWNTHLFNKLETCTFTPGRGLVGTAFAEQRNIWTNGPSVHRLAGSELQARILEHARIETAVYIPSAETVLELGTSGIVPEDMELMSNIREFTWEHILPALGHAPAPHVSQSPLAPLLSHESQGFLSQGFELKEQTRRAPSLNIDDIFLQHPSEGGELGLVTSSVSTVDPTWLPSPTTSRPTDLLPSPNSQALPVSAANRQVLRRFQAYRSLSGTTSSSLSSLEDTSVMDSPEPSVSVMAPSSGQRHSSHNYASSSARRETPTHSPEFQLVDTTRLAPHLHEAFRHLLDSQEPWSQMYIDPSVETPNLPERSGFAFKSWPQTHVPRWRERRMNQGLLRRSFEILRQIRDPRRSNQPLQNASVLNREGSRSGPSSSSPEDMPANDQAGPSRGRRPYRGTGPRGSGNDEAARIHMLSERQRRKRQKENFVALRKLVPIISKNDKASILGDAITYIKDLQAQIQEAQAHRAEIQSRYEALKSTHQELQERNKLLEALVAVTSSGGASSSILPPL